MRKVILQDGDIFTLKKTTYDIAVKKHGLYLEKFIADKLAGKEVILRSRWDRVKSIGACSFIVEPTLLVSPVQFSDIKVSVPPEAIDLRKPLLRGQCKISLIKSRVSIPS